MILRPAERLLLELGMEDPEDIDLELIAFQQGAEILYKPLKGCAAHIIGAGARAVITIDSTQPTSPERQRFSIAHELGHWLNHRGKTLACTKRQMSGPPSALDPEAVANGFAADLLMPAMMARRHFSGRPVTFETVGALARMFSVSSPAAAIRLVDLTDHDAMVLSHAADGRREWFHGSRRVQGALWPHQRLSPDTDAADILRGNTPSPRPVTVDADDWIEHDAARDYRILEHFMATGTSVLTLLWWKDPAMVDAFSH